MEAQKLRLLFRQHDISLTKQRQEVISFISNNGPISMKDLAFSLSEKVDRATVYRSVNCFIEKGLLTKISYGWKFKIALGESFTIHQHYAICKKCRNTVVLRHDYGLEKAIESLTHELGFVSTEHRFEIEGLCKGCQRTISPS